MTNGVAHPERGAATSREKPSGPRDVCDVSHESRAPARDAQLAWQVAAAVPGCGRVNVRRIGQLCGVFDGGASADAPVGFVIGGEVYLKAGPEGITRYIACGMRPFRPGPRQPLRGYWRIPADVLADAAALRAWAAVAVDAVRRFGKRPRALRRRRRAARGSAGGDGRTIT